MYITIIKGKLTVFVYKPLPTNLKVESNYINVLTKDDNSFLQQKVF